MKLHVPPPLADVARSVPSAVCLRQTVHFLFFLKSCRRRQEGSWRPGGWVGGSISAAADALQTRSWDLSWRFMVVISRTGWNLTNQNKERRHASDNVVSVVAAGC